MSEKLKKIEEEIKLLEAEKRKEELRIEVEKLKKTVVEETVIIHRETHQYKPNTTPYYPYAPIWC